MMCAKQQTHTRKNESVVRSRYYISFFLISNEFESDGNQKYGVDNNINDNDSDKIEI